MSKVVNPVKPLADVNVIKKNDGNYHVVVCFMPDPDLVFGEGETKAFLALDGSASLKKMYGGGVGFFGGEPNYVEAVAQKIGSILTSVSRSGKVKGLYWAVTPEGNGIEEIGLLNSNEWLTQTIGGPSKSVGWGRGTKLLPVIKYGFENIFNGSKGTMGVIITDGIIEDENDCMSYCAQIGRSLENTGETPFKLVLIGIGEEVDQEQLERFDDMFEGTGIDYDLWSHGMVASMKDEEDILNVLYGELITKDTIVAPSGRLETVSGKLITSWSDGMPGKFEFTLPKGETGFVIKSGNQSVVQDVSSVL